MESMKKISAVTLLVTVSFVTAATADIDVYSDGSDFALTVGPGETATIDLGGAVTGNWDDPSPQPTSGIFDTNMWAVVFKYTTVDVQSGGTVNFANHPSGAPVVWLVQGSVNISGTVSLNGDGGHQDSQNRTYSEPGPGGFRGGRGSDSSSSGSAGFGPGGARLGSSLSFGSGGGFGSSGGYGEWDNVTSGGTPGAVYGNPLVLPLIGGSGGSGGQNGSSGGGGGAGGGAILIASNTTITVAGTVRANGGNYGSSSFSNGRGAGGPGSGGAIRLVGDTVTGGGSLSAIAGSQFYYNGSNSGGYGGVGRIRVEANSITLSDPGTPVFTVGLPGSPVKIWPDALAPVIRVISLNGHPVSISPKRGLYFPDQEVYMSEAATVPLVIQAYNVPAAATLTIRIIRKSGSDSQYSAILVDEPAGLWQADVQIPSEISAIQVRAVLP